eukprot:m.279463 g.279463  ORF g.279463 m.279463 type:complete len:296 (+) comp17730_c0_seq4:4348-5235(+)
MMSWWKKASLTLLSTLHWMLLTSSCWNLSIWPLGTIFGRLLISNFRLKPRVVDLKSTFYDLSSPEIPFRVLNAAHGRFTPSMDVAFVNWRAEHEKDFETMVFAMAGDRTIGAALSDAAITLGLSSDETAALRCISTERDELVLVSEDDNLPSPYFAKHYRFELPPQNQLQVDTKNLVPVLHFWEKTSSFFQPFAFVLCNPGDKVSDVRERIFQLFKVCHKLSESDFRSWKLYCATDGMPNWNFSLKDDAVALDTDDSILPEAVAPNSLTLIMEHVDRGHRSRFAGSDGGSVKILN